MELPPWIADEDDLAVRTVAALGALIDEEQGRTVLLSNRLRELLEERNSHQGDQIQRRAMDEAIAEVEQERTAHERARVKGLSPAAPYFGHLRLEEDGRRRDLLIGKGSGIAPSLPAPIVDWRNAPISGIFYAYDQGESFDAEIAGRERVGVVEVKRTVDVAAGVVQSITVDGVTARRGAGHAWTLADPRDRGARAQDEDHRLPDIIALITREQFQILTRSDTGVVVLRGQAGSGKTTVALHRIAYLHFQDPVRFARHKIMVVMFNKALQVYVRRALSDLELGGVQVFTFHAWAARMLGDGGERPRFVGGTPASVARLMAHPELDGLLVDHVRGLGERLAAWLPVPAEERAVWEATPGSGWARLDAFWRGGGRRAPALRQRLVRRIADHAKDVAGLFDDAEAVAARLGVSEAVVRAAAAHGASHLAAGTSAFEHAALLLRVGQLKAGSTAMAQCSWRHRYAHIVVDEAQDLSPIQVAALVDAADARRSVTLAGDPAQTLYDVGGTALSGGMTVDDRSVAVDTLPVGHRSTAPIMRLALRARGESSPELIAATRPGADPIWWRGPDASPGRMAGVLREVRRRRPASLVAVLCRDRAAADRWFADLSDFGVPELRRGDRDRFGFGPGVVVSNVHQVKGLEFDGVVLVDPAAYGERERNLLHVAITRAAEWLWVAAPRGGGVLDG